MVCYILVIILVFTVFSLLLYWKASKHWEPDEYFHLMHIRSFRRSGKPYPDGWTGAIQHDYPLLFHRFLSYLPLGMVRVYVPIIFEILNGILIVVFTYYVTSSWKISLTALVIFLFNESTQRSLFLAPRSFSLLFFNLLFVVLYLHLVLIS